MLRHSGVVFRLYPTDEQQGWLARQFGCGRWVYNHFLARRKETYETTGTGLSHDACCKELKALKRQAETGWLAEVNAQALQQSLLNLDTAYQRFFDGVSRYPQFKRREHEQRARFPQYVQLAGSGRQARVFLPKLGWVRCTAHRAIRGTIKSATVIKKPSGRYEVGLLIEQTVPEVKPKTEGGKVGLDLGLTHYVTLSTGEKIAAPRYLREAEQRLKHLQRKLARCQKGSKGYEKVRRQVARQHEKVANQRSDFLHKLSRRLVDENQVLGVEDLSVQNLLKNHCLAQSIADAGWGEFLRQLEYKAAWSGCEIRQANRTFPSSQLCHHCGWRNRDLRLRDRTWTCLECGVTHDRDINAALNLIQHPPTAGTAGRQAGGAGDSPPSSTR